MSKRQRNIQISAITKGESIMLQAEHEFNETKKALKIAQNEKAALEKQVNTLKDQLASSQVRILELENSIKQLNGQSPEVRTVGQNTAMGPSTSSDQNSEVNWLKNELALARAEKEKTMKDKEAMRGEYFKLEKVIGEKETMIAHLTQEKHSLQNLNMIPSTSNSRNMALELENLKKELAKARGDKEIVEKNAVALHEDWCRLNNLLGQKNATIATMTQERQAEHIRFMTDLKSKDDQLTKIKEKFQKEKDESINAAFEMTRELQNENTGLKRQIEDLLKRLEAAQKDSQQATRRSHEMDIQRAGSSMSIHEISESSKKIEELTAKNAQLESQIEIEKQLRIEMQQHVDFQMQDFVDRKKAMAIKDVERTRAIKGLNSELYRLQQRVDSMANVRASSEKDAMIQTLQKTITEKEVELVESKEALIKAQSVIEEDQRKIKSLIELKKALDLEYNKLIRSTFDQADTNILRHKISMLEDENGDLKEKNSKLVKKVQQLKNAMPNSEME